MGETSTALSDRLYCSLLQFADDVARCPDDSVLTVVMLQDMFELDAEVAETARERLIADGRFVREGGFVKRVRRYST